MSAMRFPLAAMILATVLVLPGSLWALPFDPFHTDRMSIAPPSGVATPADLLTIDVGGVAGTSLVPHSTRAFLFAPNVVIISLATPYEIGATVLTPWHEQLSLGPLEAGAYDFYLMSTIGAGQPSQQTYGPELFLSGFAVVPESSGLQLPGDFNGDGMVDAGDYITWRKGLGTTYTPTDFETWRLNFGQISGSGGGSLLDTLSGSNVPEPTALVLILISALGSLAFLRRSLR
jgi:hypothetical protein